MKFYIASRLENAGTVKRVAEVLKAAGHEHTYDWTVHGSVQKEGVKRLNEVAIAAKKGVMDAETVILILPGGRGTHTELGIALGASEADEIRTHKKKIVLICAENDEMFQEDERTCAFYWDNGVEKVVGTMDVWLQRILRCGYLIDHPYMIF